jgi:hypothetical protein
MTLLLQSAQLIAMPTPAGLVAATLESCHAGRVLLGGIAIGVVLATCYFGWLFAQFDLIARPRKSPTPAPTFDEVAAATMATDRDPIESTRDVAPLIEIPPGRQFPVHINPIDHRRTGVELRIPS